MKRIKPVEFTVPLKAKMTKKDVKFIVEIAVKVEEAFATAVGNVGKVADLLMEGRPVRLVKKGTDPADPAAEGWDLTIDKLVNGVKKYAEAGGTYFMDDDGYARFNEIVPPGTVQIVEFALFGKATGEIY